MAALGRGARAFSTALANRRSWDMARCRSLSFCVWLRGGFGYVAAILADTRGYGLFNAVGR